jgi:translation initiation factor 3 subunit G
MLNFPDLRTFLILASSRPDWADDEELDDGAAELPPQQITTNKDGTKTIITYRLNDDGKKVKTTRRIRTTVHKEVVNPRVAERKSWGKFGLSAKDKAGPAIDTTSVGENIIFKPSVNWRKDAKEEKTEVGSMKDKLKDKKVKCRICNGEHFTARCPFKDTMAPVGEEGAAEAAAGGADIPEGPGGLGSGKSSYVPPHLRNGGGAAREGDRMGGGKYERDDLATLRVTNASF